MHPTVLWGLVKSAGAAWVTNKASRLGAALAYYTVFSLAPLLVIVIGITGLVFGAEAVQSHVAHQIHGLVGEQGGKAIESMVEGASKPGTGLLGSGLGISMLLVGAAGLFTELQDALNTVWGVEPKSGRGIAGVIRDRFLSFSMVLGAAFLLLVSLVVSAALAALVELLGDWQTGLVGHVINEIVSFAVITLLFAMIYRFLPDAKVGWGDVWLGAVLTSILFVLGKLLIGLYLGHSSIASAYGAAGSLAVLLVWLYYSAQIFLFGAELTKAYADKFGSRIVPADNAVPVTEEARARQGLSPAIPGQPAGRPTQGVLPG